MINPGRMELIAMGQSYQVTGTLTDGQTVKLDRKLPVLSSRVHLVVEPVEESRKSSRQEALARIHARQRERGHVAPTREEVDEYIRKERQSWEC